MPLEPLSSYKLTFEAKHTAVTDEWDILWLLNGTVARLAPASETWLDSFCKSVDVFFLLDCPLFSDKHVWSCFYCLPASVSYICTRAHENTYNDHKSWESRYREEALVHRILMFFLIVRVRRRGGPEGRLITIDFTDTNGFWPGRGVRKPCIKLSFLNAYWYMLANSHINTTSLY